MAMNINDAMNNGILDQSYKIDFGHMHDFIAGEDRIEIKKCMLFGSKPPSSDSIWNIARKAGFEVITEDRNIANKEKKIDTGIVAAMTKDAYTIADKENDVITLVAGDADFVPAVRLLVEDGFTVDVAFWSHASRELREGCSKFIELNQVIDHLSYKKC